MLDSDQRKTASQAIVDPAISAGRTLEVTFDISRRTSRSGIILRWALVALVMTLIFFGSAIPGDKKPGDPFPNADKTQHFAAYGLLAVTLYVAIRASSPGRSRLFHYTATVAAAVLYGIVDEGHQHFVPGRQMSLLDLYADTIGATVLAAGMHFIRVIGGREP